MADDFLDEFTRVNAAADLMVGRGEKWDNRYNRLTNAVNSALASRNAAAASYLKLSSTAGTGAGGTGTGTTTGDPKMAGAVYGANGFNATQYRLMASQMGTAAGVEYCYGPGPALYGNAGNENYPPLYENVDHDGNEFSRAWNPSAQHARGCTLGYCGSWQLGGPVHANEAGMYSSNMGQVIFVPNDRTAAVGGLGISDLISFECGANTATTKPELPWHYGGQGTDAMQAKAYKSEGKNVSYIVSIGRAEGRPGWGISNLSVTRDGLVFVTGQNTGFNRATCQLAAGFVPTFICQLNSNEFAFVCGWDTINNRGRVAVIAVAGTPQNSYLGSDTTQWEQYRGELRGVFPGVPNYGNISFLKCIDYLDLPETMKCPTACAASTFQYWGAYQQFQDNNLDNNGSGWDLRKATHRAQFAAGGPRYEAWGKRGVLAVISKEERLAALFDLKPLLDFYTATYTSANGVGEVGYNAGQFPLTFAESPGQKPPLMKTISFTGRPTAVKALRFDLYPFVLVATEEDTRGTLNVIELGANLSVHVAPLNIANAKIITTVPIGRNPTCIATVTRHAGAGGSEGGSGEASYFGKRIYANADFQHTVIVNCRGDREGQWVEFNQFFTAGSIVRRLRSDKLLDPIWVEDNENHTTEHYEVSFADYSGQVANFRYGPLIFWNWQGNMTDGGGSIPYNWDVGLPPDGIKVKPTIFKGVTHNIEVGGFHKTPGRAFQLGFANVY